MNKFKNTLAPTLAFMSWLTSMTVDYSYGMLTWQCVGSLMITDFLFIVIITNSRVNYIRAHWMSVILLFSMVYSGSLTIVTYLRAYHIIAENSGGYMFMVYSYQYISLVASLLLFLVALIPQWLLGRFDDLCWPNTFSDFHIFDNYDSWQDDTEKQRCRYKQ